MSLFMKTELLQITKKLRKTLQVENTVWKLQKFSVTQILREIKVGKSIVSKSAILTHLEVLNFDISEFCTFCRLKFTKSTKFGAFKMTKTVTFRSF